MNNMFHITDDSPTVGAWVGGGVSNVGGGGARCSWTTAREPQVDAKRGPDVLLGKL